MVGMIFNGDGKVCVFLNGQKSAVELELSPFVSLEAFLLRSVIGQSVIREDKPPPRPAAHYVCPLTEGSFATARPLTTHCENEQI